MYQVELLRVEPFVFEILNFKRAVLGDAPAELVKEVHCREAEVQIGLDGTKITSYYCSRGMLKC